MKKRIYFVVISCQEDVQDYGKNWMSCWGLRHAIGALHATRNHR